MYVSVTLLGRDGIVEQTSVTEHKWRFSNLFEIALIGFLCKLNSLYSFCILWSHPFLFCRTVSLLLYKLDSNHSAAAQYFVLLLVQVLVEVFQERWCYVSVDCIIKTTKKSNFAFKLFYESLLWNINIFKRL